jgi:hypothetical protein
VKAATVASPVRTADTVPDGLKVTHTAVSSKGLSSELVLLHSVLCTEYCVGGQSACAMTVRLAVSHSGGGDDLGPLPHGGVDLVSMVRSLNLPLQSAEGSKLLYFYMLHQSSSRACVLTLNNCK